LLAVEVDCRLSVGLENTLPPDDAARGSARPSVHADMRRPPGVALSFFVSADLSVFCDEISVNL